jgi:hypothetical protein
MHRELLDRGAVAWVLPAVSNMKTPISSWSGSEYPGLISIHSASSRDLALAMRDI